MSTISAITEIYQLIQDSFFLKNQKEVFLSITHVWFVLVDENT